MGAESTVLWRHIFSSILKVQLIMSVLDGCHVIIFEIHCVLGEYLLVFSVLQ